MIVMTIFLILSVLFIIGTVIYVKRKDKRNITTFPLSNAETKEKKKDIKKDKKKLSNILQIKIKDNIICLGNRYSIVASLGSISLIKALITDNKISYEDIKKIEEQNVKIIF